MRLVRQRSATDQLFWRNYSDDKGGRASANLFTHAIHIPNLRPTIGADLAELLPSLTVKEWMIHELSHVSMGQTGLLAFLKRLIYATNFALYSLDADVILHIPSWTIRGNDAVARLFPKIVFLLEDLEPDAAIVDEVLRTTQTLVNQAGFVAINQIPLEAFQAARANIRAILEKDAESNPASMAIWQLSDRLFRDVVARGAGRASIWQLHALLMEIDTYVFTTPIAHLSEWWRTGSVPPEQAPLTRVETVLRCLETTPGDVTNALRAIAALGSAEPSAGDDGVQPDPFAETAMAFGWDPETAPYVHPVGRAITYLDTGYSPASRDEQTSGQRWQSRSLVVPLAEESSPDSRTCQFEVRVPIESPALDRSGISGETAPDQMMASLVQSLATRYTGRLTVMPLSTEARLLWDLQSILEDLLSCRLRCTCAIGDASLTCNRRALLERVYRSVRTDAGEYLPPLSCWSSG